MILLVVANLDGWKLSAILIPEVMLRPRLELNTIKNKTNEEYQDNRIPLNSLLYLIQTNFIKF